MKKSILTLLFLTTFISLFGQSEDNRLKGIEKEIEKWMEVYKAVGLSIATVENKEIVLAKALDTKT